MSINTFKQQPTPLYSQILSQSQTKDPKPTVSSLKRSHVTDEVIQQEVMNEQVIKEATKKEVDKQTVSDLIIQSNRYIISISSHFLFQIFPNSIDVQEHRVTFTFRQFLSRQSFSVNIEDISNVLIQSSFFFATLQIVSRTYVQNEILVGYLNPRKAERVRMIIEGLRTFAENKIDTSVYNVKNLLAKIEELNKHQTT
jgi:hypothetical protein